MNRGTQNGKSIGTPSLTFLRLVIVFTDVDADRVNGTINEQKADNPGASFQAWA